MLKVGSKVFILYNGQDWSQSVIDLAKSKTVCTIKEIKDDRRIFFNETEAFLHKENVIEIKPRIVICLK